MKLTIETTGAEMAKLMLAEADLKRGLQSLLMETGIALADGSGRVYPDHFEIEIKVTDPIALKIGDPVYFGRGPVEFIGKVVSNSPGLVMVSGVETGCLSTRCITADVSRVENLRRMDAAEWAARTKNEPAFAGEMTKERFMALQKELEGLEMSIAKGQEDDETDFSIQVVTLLMENSPWVMHPDHGCIAKSEVE